MTNLSHQGSMATATSSPNSAAEKAHLNFLDGLRAGAALFVVLHHAYLHINNGDLGLHGLLNGIKLLYYGHFAVDLFIVLSGFCLMLPVVRDGNTLRGGSLEFFRRRARRILPTYYAALFFSLLLISTLIGHKTGSHWDMSLPVTWKGFWTHFLLLHDAFGQDFTINHVFWSIAVEWRIYFFFPLLVLLWKKIGALPAVAMALIASLLLYKLAARLVGSPMNWHYLGLFALGCFACAIAFGSDLARWRQAPWGWILLASSLGVAIMALAIRVPLWHGHLMPLSLADYMVGLWAMSLLVHLSLHPQGTLHRALSWKPLAFIGTFAYSIYLIHAPLQQLVWQEVVRPLHLSPQATFWALVALTPLIVLASYGFFWVAERPFLSKKQRKADDRIAAQAQAVL